MGAFAVVDSGPFSSLLSVESSWILNSAVPKDLEISHERFKE